MRTVTMVMMNEITNGEELNHHENGIVNDPVARGRTTAESPQTRETGIQSPGGSTTGTMRGMTEILNVEGAIGATTMTNDRRSTDTIVIEGGIRNMKAPRTIPDHQVVKRKAGAIGDTGEKLTLPATPVPRREGEGDHGLAIVLVTGMMNRGK